MATEVDAREGIAAEQCVEDGEGGEAAREKHSVEGADASGTTWLPAEGEVGAEGTNLIRDESGE